MRQWVLSALAVSVVAATLVFSLTLAQLLANEAEELRRQRRVDRDVNAW